MQTDKFAPERAPNPGLRGNVMVVDDNAMNRRLMRHFLEIEHFNVVEASGGLEAIESLRQSRFDLVLLDIAMPEVDGYQTLEALKQDQDLRDVPVVMVSAIDDMASITRCIELGADSYVLKPLSRQPLMARINTCLEKRRQS
jgi:CheY-like chemotaxis protein